MNCVKVHYIANSKVNENGEVSTDHSILESFEDVLAYVLLHAECKICQILIFQDGRHIKTDLTTGEVFKLDLDTKKYVRLSAGSLFSLLENL